MVHSHCQGICGCHNKSWLFVTRLDCIFSYIWSLQQDRYSRRHSASLVFFMAIHLSLQDSTHSSQSVTASTSLSTLMTQTPSQLPLLSEQRRRVRLRTFQLLLLPNDLCILILPFHLSQTPLVHPVRVQWHHMLTKLGKDSHPLTSSLCIPRADDGRRALE